jgi:predicted RNase H-like nuclease (RuvC/YqgF family)
LAASRSDRNILASPSVVASRDLPQTVSPDEATRGEPVSGGDSRPTSDEWSRAGPLMTEQQTLEQLLEYVRRLIKKYQALESENQVLRQRLDDLQRRAEAAEQENQRLRARLETLEAERDAIRLQVAELVRELETLELE